MKRSLIILSLFFLLIPFSLIPTSNYSVRADVLETFSYDSVFWEDWERTNLGSYNWREQNSTMNLYSNSTSATYNESVLNRDFEIDDGEDSVAIEYLYRATTFENGSLGAWWNTTFSYRKPHSILGSSDGVQTDYQVRFIIYYGSGTDSGENVYLNSKCQTDFDDIRFIKSDHSTELDYWIQNETASSVAIFWVEIDSIPVAPNTVTIYIYYGHNTVTDNSNGLATFIFFDDFNDNSFNTTKWTVQAGTGYDEASGKLELWDTGGARTLIDAEAVAATLYDIRYMVSARHEDNTAGSFNHLKIHQKGNIFNDEVAKLWLTGTDNIYARTANDAATTTSGIMSSPDTTVYNEFSLTWISGEVLFYTYESLIYTSTTNIPNEALVPAFWTGSQAMEVSYVDWCFMGKYTDNEPVHAAYGLELEYGLSIHLEFESAINYNATASVSQKISLKHNTTDLLISYYNWSSTLSTVNYSFSGLSVSYNDYLRVEIEIDAYLRTAVFNINDISGNNVIDKTVFVDVVPERLLSFTFNNSANCYLYEYANVESELVYIEAPFGDVEFIRDWDTINFENSDSPYFITTTTVQWENASTKIMPFQGFKALWNASLAGTDKPMLIFDWYSRNGTYQGGIMFKCEKTTPYQYTFWTSPDGMTWTNQYVFRLTEWTIAIAVWIDEGGRAFAYMQENPESHTFCDFYVYDITDFVDFDSWGITLTHCLEETSGGSNVFTALKEVEIFAGRREGISQPRFGGMVWLYNPFLIFIYWLATSIQQVAMWVIGILTPVIVALGTYLSPFIAATTAAVSGLVSYLADTVSRLNNIWGVVTSIIVDMGLRIIEVFQNTLIPFIFANFWSQVNVVLATLNTFITTVLAAVSLALYGDATILPATYTALVTALQTLLFTIGTFIGDGVIFLTMLFKLATGQPVVGFAFSNTGLSFIYTIFYYVATYLPVVIFMHILLTLLKAVNDKSIEPFIGLMIIYITIGKIIFDVVMSAINLIIGIVSAIGGYIPFT